MLGFLFLPDCGLLQKMYSLGVDQCIVLKHLLRPIGVFVLGMGLEMVDARFRCYNTEWNSSFKYKV